MAKEARRSALALQHLRGGRSGGGVSVAAVRSQLGVLRRDAHVVDLGACLRLVFEAERAALIVSEQLKVGVLIRVRVGVRVRVRVKRLGLGLGSGLGLGLGLG